ncbi:MAG: DNA polymerase III subunit alpha [Nitrospira sp.]|nr:DNA polymerase III subunit alpha [Nitrospira sp.]MDH4245566.1 DNA polymerase III subunit alpha [Nitrospira sp.]MDH4356393.1 DNA polymerase III subunit alpha [Nitrospira sp.]MDH5318302.1 DNA polymerase III subunit alpha [Nitrospira sp.]
MSSSFVHLHLHTQFSLLDGANQIEPLVRQIKSFSQPAVAMTDHGNMFGAVEFYRKAKDVGVKPIIGCEAYMALGSRHAKKDSGLAHNDYYHLILLARNLTGYQNLIKLVSKGYLEGFYYKPRIDKELLKLHHDGIIALSGCLSGEIPYLIGQKDMAGAMAVAGEFQEIFGKDHFYLEVQANGLDHQRIANAGLIEIHKTLGIPMAGTNDCHYLNKEDARPHELMLCLQTGKTLSDPNRMKFDTDQLYVKSTEEIAPAFAEFPDAVMNTCRIADHCDLDLPLNKTHLPQYRVPEGFRDRESYLEHLAIAGLKERLKERPSRIAPPVYEQRLKEELMVICSMGFAGYFLIVWDIIRFARSRTIPVGPGRGSAAGSLVAYALRITDLDPLVYTLLFERFLNPERVSLPDIDMDFCMDRRGEVINYVVDKYGTDHVAQIITFGTLGAKAAIRDVGRVLELSYADADKVAKLVPNQLNITLQQALETEPRLRELVETDPKVKELMANARSLEGLARHASTHAAGVVISEGPLTDHVPLYKGANDEIVTQYSMGDVEKIGLVKFDFLGLKTLTMIRRAETLINETHSEAPPLVIDQVPFDDPATFALLSSGKTTGLFQLESSGMRDLLTGLKPDRFEDIIAIIALYRPGPMDLIPDFIKRKQGKVPITYEAPELEPILKDTYGVIVYQEQVMAIANKVAGFSLGQADILRRAMGKKKPEEMEKLRVKFIDGAKQNRIPENKAQKLYELIQKFAGYGFNKSHAAAYAVICYQTGFLKAHYPTEFMAALMTTDMGNQDKLVGYFTECRDLGIKVLGPDVNASQTHFAVADGAIRFGLAAIKNVGEGAVESVLDVRSRTGPFGSFFDFCRRVDLHKVNKRMLEGLIKAGAFDSTKAKRSQLMAVLDQAVEEGAAAQREREVGQTSIFGEDLHGERATVALPAPALPSIAEWDQAQRLKYERELTGFYISAHPLARYEATLGALSTTSTIGLKDCADNGEVKLCGIIATVKSMLTKKGDRMAYLTVEDLHGTAEVIVFPDLFKTAGELITPERIVRISGTIDRGDKGTKIRGSKIEPLAEVQAQAIKRIRIRLTDRPEVQAQLPRLLEVLRRHPGNTTISMSFRTDGTLEAETAPLPNLTICPSDHFISDVEEVLGKGALSLLS